MTNENEQQKPNALAGGCTLILILFMGWCYMSNKMDKKVEGDQPKRVEVVSRKTLNNPSSEFIARLDKVKAAAQNAGVRALHTDKGNGVIMIYLDRDPRNSAAGISLMTEVELFAKQSRKDGLNQVWLMSWPGKSLYVRYSNILGEWRNKI